MSHCTSCRSSHPVARQSGTTCGTITIVSDDDGGNGDNGNGDDEPSPPDVDGRVIALVGAAGIGYILLRQRGN